MGLNHMYTSGPLDATVVLQIFVASLCSVGTVAVLAAPGVILARQGVISRDVSRGLSHVAMQITIPCLLFSSVMPNVDAQVLRACWPLVVLPFLYVPIGLAVGSLVVRICEPGESFRKGTIAAVAFGNSTGMPIVLLTVVHAALGGPSDVDPMLFLSVYLIFYPALQWAVGGWLLGVGHAPKPHAAAQAAAPAADTGAAEAGALVRLNAVPDLEAARVAPPAAAAPRGGCAQPLRALVLLGGGGGGGGSGGGGEREYGASARATQLTQPLLTASDSGSNAASHAARARGGASDAAAESLPFLGLEALARTDSTVSLSELMPNLVGLVDGERFLVTRLDEIDSDSESSSGADDDGRARSEAADGGTTLEAAGDGIGGAELGSRPLARGGSQPGAHACSNGALGAPAPRAPPRGEIVEAAAPATDAAEPRPPLASRRTATKGALLSTAGGVGGSSTHHHSLHRGPVRRVLRRARRVAAQVLKPAVIAVACGIFIGLTPELKALLVPTHSAPLGWLFIGLRTIGGAAVPINLMLLGATLSTGPSWSQINMKTNIGIVVAKMLVMPIVGACARARFEPCARPGQAAEPRPRGRARCSRSR
jgi:predicted permease